MEPNKRRLPRGGRRTGHLIVVGMLLTFGPSHYSGPAISDDQARMSVEALEKMPKIDVHAHISDFGDTGEESVIAMLAKHNFKWLDICVVGTEWEKLQRKVTLAKRFHKSYPQRIAWATSFNLTNWGKARLGEVGSGHD
jgi:hypothetical protein